MHETPLPVDAATGDARHRDVREAIFAVIPQRQATLGARLFWRLVLIAGRFPAVLRYLERRRHGRAQDGVNS